MILAVHDLKGVPAHDFRTQIQLATLGALFFYLGFLNLGSDVLSSEKEKDVARKAHVEALACLGSVRRTMPSGKAAPRRTGESALPKDQGWVEADKNR